MDCKRALVDTGGDLTAAERRLKEMGLSAAAKRSGRATTEGRVFSTVNGAAAILELSSETDFVARNTQFVELGEKLVAEIALGRLQAPTEHMQQLITEAIGRIKENIALRRFRSVALTDGDRVAHYLHGEGNIGVLVKLHAADPAKAQDQRMGRVAFDLALHVAAFAPPFLASDHVAAEYLAEQEAIFRKQAEAMDKPAQGRGRNRQGQAAQAFAGSVSARAAVREGTEGEREAGGGRARQGARHRGVGRRLRLL